MESDLDPVILAIVSKLTAGGDATAANQVQILADVAVVDAIVDAIKAKTDNLPTDPADESLIQAAIADLISRVKGLNDIHDDVGTVDTVVDGIQTDLSNATDGLGALKALIDTVDGLHDVPTKDAATDAQMRDVVGKKDDTAVATVGTTKSLVAYVKGVMNDLSNATDGLGALKTLIDTCTGYHTVAVKDAATDAKMRDVVGKKDDTAVAAVGTTKSLVAYTKGIMNDLSNATDGLGALKALIDALNDLSAANVTTACTSSLNTYDPPTRSEATTDKNAIITEVNANETKIDTVDTVVDGIQTDLSNATDGLGALKTLIDAIKAKTDLMNSASGSSTLNDANPSDTIVPSSLPCKMHVIFDISNLNNANDDFTLEVKVGAAAAERVVAYYKLTSDGSDITADTGSGIGNKIKVRRIDISGILVYTGEQVLLDYTKNSGTDRNVAYKYICGV